MMQAGFLDILAALPPDEAKNKLSDTMEEDERTIDIGGRSRLDGSAAAKKAKGEALDRLAKLILSKAKR